MIAGAVVSDDIMPGALSIYEGCWPSLDSQGRCNSGLVNFLTSTQRTSGLTEASTANTVLCSMRRCDDPEGPNMAYEKPPIIEDMELAAIDRDALGLDRVHDITDGLMADMGPEERIFYERCTVRHSPRVVQHFTRQQWRGITPSMFPRAGLDEAEAALVMDYLMEHASDAVQ